MRRKMRRRLRNCGNETLSGGRHNPLDQRRQLLQGRSFFRIVAVTIIDAGDAPNSVAEDALGMLALDASAGH